MNVIVVHGAPLAGKTTYVKDRMGPNDLIFDYDDIMAAITNREVHDHNKNVHGYVLDFRSLITAKLKSEKKIDTAWIIVTKPNEEFKQSLLGLNPRYKEIPVTIETVKRRLKEHPGARDQEEWNKAIDRYFMTTEDYGPFYRTPRWRRKRENILKRDEYKCKQCSRYGKTTEATTVHHVIPIETAPEHKLTNVNLMSLCSSCHGKMHDKLRGTLSELGRETLERVVRQNPELREADLIFTN